MRSVVVFPAPFGPRKPLIGPGLEREREVVDGDEIAEPLGQRLGDDDGSHAPHPRPSRRLGGAWTLVVEEAYLEEQGRESAGLTA